MGRLDRCMQLVDEMREMGLKADVLTHNLCIDASARCNDMQHARKLLGMMKRDRVRPNATTHLIMCKAYALSGQLDASLSSFAEMRRCITPVNTVDLLAVVDGLLLACARCGDIGMAKTVLSEMSASSIPPSVLTYTALIKAYANAGDGQGVAKVVDSMKQDQAVTPDIHFYESAVQGLVQCGLLKDAMGLFLSLQSTPLGAYVTHSLYATLMDGCIQKQNLELGYHLMTHAAATRIRLPMRLYTALIDAYKRCGLSHSPELHSLISLTQRQEAVSDDRHAEDGAGNVCDQDWWPPIVLTEESHRLSHGGPGNMYTHSGETRGRGRW